MSGTSKTIREVAKDGGSGSLQALGALFDVQRTELFFDQPVVKVATVVLKSLNPSRAPTFSRPG